MAAQLAETFFDDPVIGHIFRNPSRRDMGLRAYFRTQMRADYLPFGGCYTTDGYAGSAIWASRLRLPCRRLYVLTLLPRGSGLVAGVREIDDGVGARLVWIGDAGVFRSDAEWRGRCRWRHRPGLLSVVRL